MTDLEKKRELVREIIEQALINAISQGVTDYGKECGNKDEYCGNKDEYCADILCDWLEDEEGDPAVDRLVSLIIY